MNSRDQMLNTIEQSNNALLPALNSPQPVADSQEGIARARAARYGRMAEPDLPRASTLVWFTAAVLISFGVWAWLFELDEVSTSSGKVIPTSREQIVQSLEGGIVAAMRVKEGDIVQAGQVLAQLDRTRIESTVQESTSRGRAALATAVRLRAEAGGTPLVFPAEIREDPGLMRAETALYNSRRDSLQRSLQGLEQTLTLIQKELQMTEPLVARGAASDVEVLRLKRQASDLEAKATDLRTQYLVRAREELAKANAEVDVQQSVTRGRSDALARTTITSPVRGIVKDISVNTVGGVVPSNGKLMEIVPVDEKLLVEARVSPRDIAFVHPGQRATVKITAYDYSIYGALEGKVHTISPDTIQDDVRKEVFYYRVYVRTESDTLKNKVGKVFPIVPGMIATVDIHTGKKTVMDYLLKPLSHAKEALRER